MKSIAPLLALLLAAVPASAAKKKKCGPAEIAGKWGGAYACKGSNPLRASALGRADVKIEKEDEMWVATYAITESVNGSKGKSTTTGRTNLTPVPGKKNLYRASVKLDPNNLLRLKSISAVLRFTPEAKSGCAVEHEADLAAAFGALGSLASIKGRTEVEKRKQLSFSTKTRSPILNEDCSGTFTPVKDEDEEDGE